MLEDLDDQGLAEGIGYARDTLARAKSTLAALEAEMDRRMATRATAALAELGKEHGQVGYSHGGMRFKAEAKKTVKWDSEKLKAVARTMPFAMVERLFKIEFSVPEATYGAIVDPELLAKINDARTTRIDPIKVSFVGIEVE